MTEQEKANRERLYDLLAELNVASDKYPRSSLKGTCNGMSAFVMWESEDCYSVCFAEGINGPWLKVMTWMRRDEDVEKGVELVKKIISLFPVPS